jgi:hypothetical protein
VVFKGKERPMLKRMCIPIAVVVSLALVGCGIIKAKSGWCNHIPEDSYSLLCQIAHKYNTEPEDVAGVLKLGNITGLSSDLYTAKQAIDFINDLEDDARQAKDIGTVTWDLFIIDLMAKYKDLPPAVKALFIMQKDYLTVDLPGINIIPLSQYDWDGIIAHLEQQKALAAMFLET